MASTKDKVFGFFDYAVKYIKGLRFADGTLATEHDRKTGFKGFLINIENVRSIYTQFVETGKLKTFPVRRTNQDPVESFFSRCRSYSVLGNNTNPTVQQFSAAFRRLLVSNEVTSSNLANCDDNLNILFVSSNRSKKDHTTSTTAEANASSSINTESDEFIEYDEDICELLNQNLPDDHRYGIAYLAGVIENKIKKYADFNCSACENIFTSGTKLNISSLPRNKISQIPLKLTFDICVWTYDILKSELKKLEFNYDALLKKILNVDFGQFYKETDFISHEGHDYILTKYIVEEFINIQAGYVARLSTYQERMKLENTKNKKKANKIAHFKGI